MGHFLQEKNYEIYFNVKIKIFLLESNYCNIEQILFCQFFSNLMSEVIGPFGRHSDPTSVYLYR